MYLTHPGICHLVAVTISFERQSYTVRKTARPPPIRLILSEQLNTDVTIKVLDREGTAMSKSIMLN